MDTTAYKTTLENERVTLKVELDELGSKNPDEKNDWITNTGEETTNEADENIVADRAEEWESREGELSELEIRYQQILRALKKIDAGTFGTCELCQAPIETDRLAVNPAARTCKAHLNDERDLPA